MAPSKKYMDQMHFASHIAKHYPHLFTEREKQVIELYLTHTTHDVLGIMHLSYRGLYEHVYRILAKVGIETPAMNWPSRTKIREFIYQSRELNIK